MRGRGGGTKRPWRPSARAVRLRGWGCRAGTRMLFWPSLHPRSHSVLWVWQSSWQGHYGPLAKAMLPGAEARERGAREVCGAGAGLLSCRGLLSRWSARVGGAGGGEGGRERVEGGSRQQMAQAGLGLSDQRMGGGWPSAPGGRLRAPPPPPLPAQRKEPGRGAAFIPSEVSNTLPYPLPNTQKRGSGEGGERSWWRGEGSKGEGCLH